MENETLSVADDAQARAETIIRARLPHMQRAGLRFDRRNSKFYRLEIVEGARTRVPVDLTQFDCDADLTEELRAKTHAARVVNVARSQPFRDYCAALKVRTEADAWLKQKCEELNAYGLEIQDSVKVIEAFTVPQPKRPRQDEISRLRAILERFSINPDTGKRESEPDTRGLAE